MEITAIKERLTLSHLLSHYNLKPDKHARLHCPFHEDKTPSFQVYYKTHTCYCFSSNCKTHGKSLDVIDFIMYKESLSKHEAIKRAESLINGTVEQTGVTAPMSREEFLQKMFTYFKNAVHNSPQAKEYIATRCLDHSKTEIGYNGGQFHHGARKDEGLISDSLKYGLLQDVNLVSRTGDKAYKPFGKWCITFALKNKTGQVTGLYFRSTLNDKDQRHFYLKDRKGLYPHYPKPDTKKLILCESIIDTATLLQQKDIAGSYSLLALYGTNGLTEEHISAIRELSELEEIIFFLNADKAGKEAVNKYAPALQELKPKVRITNIELPEGEDVNSIVQGHDSTVLNYYLNERTVFVYSEEKNKTLESIVKTVEAEPTAQPVPLNTENPHHLVYTGEAAQYVIKGGLRPQLDSMKVSIQIIHSTTGHDYRTKLDLYEYKQVNSTAQQTADRLNIKAGECEKDLIQLTRCLDKYRSEQQSKSIEHPQIKPLIQIEKSTQARCIAFLSKPDLINNINELLGKSGIVGEETNRILLFVLASSYKMKDTLHALVQGSSGSGKTHLILKIANLMPPEDIISLTRVTDNSFYNYSEYDLENKLLCMEDLDGMKDEAFLAFRELQSRGMISSSTSIKDESGNIRSAIKIVRGPIASLSATTKGEIYEDNMSRSFLIAVDESKEQTQRIIKYQNERAAGLVDTQKEKDIKQFLQNSIRLLKPYEVINPFANKMYLPEEAHKIRRLNELYQCFVKQVTLINQYQRSKDAQGRIIAEKQDLQTACTILFESIFLKVDELDGSLRHFYEQLKTYVNKKGRDYEFNRLEVRQEIKISKTQQHSYMERLLQLEYIKQSGGHVNRGYYYTIAHWDNVAALRARIKDSLQNQLQAL